MARKRISLGQNFLTDKALVHQMVTSSNISGTDIVYEVGPGEGVITKELASVARQVTAIELDHELVAKLRQKFGDYHNITVVHMDFMQFDIPEKTYKIFSNIPFNITSDIIRRLLELDNPPETTYLIMQEEAARKFSGKPTVTEFSVIWSPWYDFTIMQQVPRHAFDPVPSVQPVLLRIDRKTNPDLEIADRKLYVRFVKHGFEAWKKSLKQAYQDIFSYKQWKRVANDLGFSIKPKPTQLSHKQWLGMFLILKKHVGSDKLRSL